MSVTRQHEAAVMEELEDGVCEKLVATYDPVTDRYHVFHMVVDGISHRFFLDAGLLFWQSHQDYDPDDDSSETEKNVDLGLRNGVRGEKVESISHDENILTLKFKNGKKLMFSQRNWTEESGAREVIPGEG